MLLISQKVYRLFGSPKPAAQACFDKGFVLCLPAPAFGEEGGKRNGAVEHFIDKRYNKLYNYIILWKTKVLAKK